MNKLVTVLGVTAVATLVGCKDPGYKSYRIQSQNEAKQVEPVAAETTAPAVEKTEKKVCSCAPGTVHAEPCKCGADDCKCVVKVEPVPSAPVEEPYTVYIVQGGDYLAKISKKFNITIAAIKSLNNLKSDVIRVGQKLKLPGKVDVGVQVEPAKVKAKKQKDFKPYQGETKEYVVKSGDTLGAIAYGNGCNIRQLKHLNSLKSDNLKVGQKLKVPAVAAKAPAVKFSSPRKNTDVETPVEKKQPAVAVETPASAAQDADAPVSAETAPVVDAQTSGDSATKTEGAAEAPATTTYVVQEGDDFTGILIRFSVSAAALRELNNLPDDAQLKPGQVIKLPAEAQQ